MGFDRLSNFLNKNLNYTYGFVIDELKRKVLANHILFDLNFIIYNQMFSLEEEINKVIKIVLNLPFCQLKNNKTEDKLSEIFDLPWWRKHCENIEYIFDGNNDNEIITKLITFINTKENNNLSKIDLMLIDKVLINTDILIETYSNLKTILNIGFFIDGIPSFSKIIEQRRRRTRNYFESMNRKEKFNKYFGNIKDIYIDEDGIKYNYFKWIEKRFSLDKSFSPISPIIKKLEVELARYYKNRNIKVFINPGSSNGEADLKIFQFIQNENLIGDILIHTTDSDFIHLMLIQQVYFNFKRIDINISIIKHNSKDDEYIQYFDGQAMVSAINKYYNQISGQNTTDYRIIYDFCLLLLFFGNDHLPTSFEIGPELGLDSIFRIYSRTKKFIINLEDDTITIDFNNFTKLLSEFQKNINVNFTKILLNRNFKMPLQITNLLTDYDKLNMDYHDVLDFIKHLLIYDGQKIFDKLNKSDIRYSLVQNNKDFDFNAYLDKIIINKENLRNMVLSNIEAILDNLDFSSLENYGLVPYKKPYLKTNDNYQDLYNILSENTVTELNNKNKLLYDPQKEDFLIFRNSKYNKEMCYSYVKKFYHLITSFFGSLKNYHTNNITAYTYDYVPKIEYLIKYLNENNDLEKIKNEIKNENLNETDYFSSVNHHVFITAYLSLDDIKDESTKNTSKLLNIDNLWIGDKNIETFYHNKVPALEFLTNWDNAVRETEIN